MKKVYLTPDVSYYLFSENDILTISVVYTGLEIGEEFDGIEYFE
jgi:hypothetical protein